MYSRQPFSMNPIVFSSFAKLNLRLKVLSKRPDGYHELESLMVPLELSDSMTLTVADGQEIKVSCDHPQVPIGKENIVYRAIERFLKDINQIRSVMVKIDKRIPIAAGMGGGSSNAAAALRALNDFFQRPLTEDRLNQIALSLGADVPFFLKNRPAIATGVGEKLEPLLNFPRLNLIVINPGVPLSTQWVYQNWKGSHDQFQRLKSQFRTPQEVFEILENDLETVAVQRVPQILDMKKLLMSHGASVAQMTGSGPTVFGIFLDLSELEKVFEKIRNQVPASWQVFKTNNF